MKKSLYQKKRKKKERKEERKKKGRYLTWEYTGIKRILAQAGDTGKSPCFYNDFFTLLNTMGTLRADCNNSFSWKINKEFMEM